jgi:hypothetical protein
MKKLSLALAILTMGGPLATAENFGDRHNQEAAHTKTHFEVRRFASLAESEAHKPVIRRQILASAGLLPPKD